MILLLLLRLGSSGDTKAMIKKNSLACVSNMALKVVLSFAINYNTESYSSNANHGPCRAYIDALWHSTYLVCLFN